MDTQTRTSPSQPVTSSSRYSCCLTLIVVFLIGSLAGAGVLLLTEVASQGSLIATTPSSQPGAIVVQMSSTYISQLLAGKIKSSSLPGTVDNVQVKMGHNAPITVAGNDSFNILGFNVTRSFTIDVQLVVSSCQVQAHLVRVNMAGVPITAFVTSYESQLNQELQMNGSAFPEGFTYCATNVRTESNGLFITYSATPTAQ